jgi:hypothetical protein
MVCPSKVLPPVCTDVEHHIRRAAHRLPLLPAGRGEVGGGKSRVSAAREGRDRQAVRQPLVIASPHGEEGGRVVETSAASTWSPSPILTLSRTCWTSRARQLGALLFRK